MPGKAKKFKMTLPIQITGMVFWGLLLVCSLLAVIVLQQLETDFVSSNQEETLILSYEIEEIVEQYSMPPALNHAEDKIREKIQERLNTFGFHAVRLYEGDTSFSIGTTGEDDELYEYSLSYFPLDSSNPHVIKLEVYCANVKTVISELRKKILLAIGLGVLVFVLFLQLVLRKILSRPFHKMISTAEQFSQGKEDVLFDEKRPDEFGYLGKFINDAIKAILSHKNDLVLALERVSASEIALNLEKERAEVTLYSITDSVITVDINSQIVYMNPAGEKLLGSESQDVIGKPFDKVFNIVEESTGKVIDDLLKKLLLNRQDLSFTRTFITYNT